MFYFQSVSADKNKMLTCVVVVRERQRSVVACHFYTELVECEIQCYQIVDKSAKISMLLPLPPLSPIPTPPRLIFV